MFLEWSSRTGSDVVGVKMWPGERAIVALNTYAAIREAFTGSESADAFTGRPHSAFWKLSNPYARGTRATVAASGLSNQLLSMRVMR